MDCVPDSLGNAYWKIRGYVLALLLNEQEHLIMSNKMPNLIINRSSWQRIVKRVRLVIPVTMSVPNYRKRIPSLHWSVKNCGDYELVGRCWMLCNVFSRQNLTALRDFLSIVYFLNFFPCDFAHSVFLAPTPRSWNWQICPR